MDAKPGAIAHTEDFPDTHTREKVWHTNREVLEALTSLHPDYIFTGYRAYNSQALEPDLHTGRFIPLQDGEEGGALIVECSIVTSEGAGTVQIRINDQQRHGLPESVIALLGEVVNQGEPTLTDYTPGSAPPDYWIG